MLPFLGFFASGSPPAPSSSFPSTLLPPHLYTQFPHTNSFIKLPFFSETLPTPFSSELIRTSPFNIKPSEDPEAKPFVSYISWSKAELWARVKDFPKVIADPRRLAEEFNSVIHTYWPGFSDLYQLVHMLVSEGQAQHSVKLITGKILKGL